MKKQINIQSSIHLIMGNNIISPRDLYYTQNYQNEYVKIKDFCLQESLLISLRYEYETIESE